MGEEWDKIVEELAAAARRALPWIPSRTAALDGSTNPAKTRLADALTNYNKYRFARGIRRDIEGIEAIERSDGGTDSSPLS